MGEKSDCRLPFNRIINYDEIGIFTRKCTNDWMKNGAPHTVDRFATSYNAQVDRFNSRYARPGSEAVDVDWCNENNWWCPPLMLVPRVLRHAEHCKAHGTLVVPP